MIGKACGNSCINVDYQCYQPPGCACNKVEDTCYLPTPEPTPSPSPTPDPCAPSVERSLSSADPGFYIASCPISPNPIDCYLTAIALIQQGVLIADPTTTYPTEAQLIAYFEAQIQELENNPQPTSSPSPSSSPSPDPFPSPCPAFTPTPTPTPEPTCQDRYRDYSLCRELAYPAPYPDGSGNPWYFGGYMYGNFSSTLNRMRDERSARFWEGEIQRDPNSTPSEDAQFCRGPRGTNVSQHFNVFLVNTTNSVGSIGQCRCCVDQNDGNPEASLRERFAVLNLKDGQGNKIYRPSLAGPPDN